MSSCVRLITSGKVGTIVKPKIELENNLKINFNERTLRRRLNGAELKSASKEKSLDYQIKIFKLNLLIQKDIKTEQ